MSSSLLPGNATNVAQSASVSQLAAIKGLWRDAGPVKRPLLWQIPGFD